MLLADDDIIKGCTITIIFLNPTMMYVKINYLTSKVCEPLIQLKNLPNINENEMK